MSLLISYTGPLNMKLSHGIKLWLWSVVQSSQQTALIFTDGWVPFRKSCSVTHAGVLQCTCVWGQWHLAVTKFRKTGLLSGRLISSDFIFFPPLHARKLFFICCSLKLLRNRFACLLSCLPLTDSCAKRVKGLVSFTHITRMHQTRC